MSVVEKAGKAGGKVKQFTSGFLFELYIELNYKEIVGIMAQCLAGISPSELKQMVAERRYPELPSVVYQNLHGYEKYLKNITDIRLFKALAKGCPELAMAIDDLGTPGYYWIHRFRNRIIERVAAGGLLPEPPGESSVEMVPISCDGCGRSWALPRDKFEKLTECPFCHQPANTPAEQPPPDLLAPD